MSESRVRINPKDLEAKCQKALENLEKEHKRRREEVIQAELNRSKRGLGGWIRKVFGKEMTYEEAIGWAWDYLMPIDWAYEDKKNIVRELLYMSWEAEEDIELSRSEYALLYKWVC